MKNSKQLNRSLSIASLACFIMAVVSFYGISGILGLILSRGGNGEIPPIVTTVPFFWEFGATYLIFLGAGLVLMLIKFIVCTIKNLKESKEATYAKFSLVFDILAIVAAILLLVAFIMQIPENDINFTPILILQLLGVPLILVATGLGRKLSKRCYK